MLNECLTVMVSRPELSPKTLLNIGNPQKGNENTGHGDARQKTPSSLNHTARCLSPTRLLFQQLLSVVASITAFVVSSIPVLRILSTSVDSLLLLVEAKFDLCVDFALAQLVVYLGSLRHMKRVLGCFWEPKIDAGEKWRRI